MAQGQLARHKEILDQLRSAPEAEIVTVLHRLRAMPSLTAATASLSSRTTQPPTIQLALRPAEHDKVFELTLPQCNTHSTTAASDFPSIDTDGFLRDTLQPTNHPGPAVVQMNPITPSSLSTNDGVDSKLFSSNTVSPFREGTEGVESIITGSSQHLQYCDARLSNLDVKYWTTIPIHDELAARAISNYLENYHPLTGFFDADLFLTGLNDRNPEYCTAFLFNALLCQACVSGNKGSYNNS